MERGTEIRNQIRRVANIVPRGTAPEEWAPIRKKFRTMNVPKTILNIKVLAREKRLVVWEWERDCTQERGGVLG